MSLEALIATMLPMALMTGLSLWLQGIIRRGDKVDQALEKRLSALEAHVSDHTQTDVREHRELDVRVAQAETEARGHQGDLEAIRKLIEESFKNINARIDGLYSRSGSPVPGRRR